MTKKITFVFLISVLSAFSSVSFADAMDDCMNEEIAKLKAVEPFTSQEQGCVTKDTGSDGVRHSCDAPACYKAPAQYTIKGQVTPHDTNAQGSEHSISAVNYQYNSYGQTEMACVIVHARGPHGHNTGRGWQKVKLTGEIEKVVDQDAIKQVAKLCAKKTG